MGAVTVNLPRSQVPVFPAHCIRCGAAEPDRTWRVCTRAIGWWTITLMSFGSRFCAHVPACHSCRGRLRRGAGARSLLEWVLIFVAVGLAMWVLGGQQGFWVRWAIIGLALLALLPMFVWDLFYPPLLDLTAYSRTVDYDFRDAAYAKEFEALNSPSPSSAEPIAAPDIDRVGTSTRPFS